MAAVFGNDQLPVSRHRHHGRMIPPVLHFEGLPVGTLFFRLSTGQDDQGHVAERMFGLRPLGPQARELFVFERVDSGGETWRNEALVSAQAEAFCLKET